MAKVFDITDEAAFKPASPAAPAGPLTFDIADEAAFRPDAAPAPAAAPAAPARPAPDAVEAFGRGAAQGASLGFADELVGFGKALLSGTPKEYFGSEYRTHRDEYRAGDRAAREAHGGAFLAGEIGGGVASSFVPGLGAARGAGLLASAGKAAALGAAAGVGSSEAEDAKGLARDALVGGLAGAGTDVALRGVGRLIRGAPARVETREAKKVLEGVPAGAQDKALAKLGGNAGLRQTLKDEGLTKVARKDPGGFLDSVQEIRERLGAKIGGVYKAADARSPGVQADKVIDSLATVREAAAKRGDVAAVGAIDAEMKGLAELWAGRPHIPAEDVHAVVQRYGRAGFGGNYFNPTEARKLGREMNEAVKGVLQQHVDDVARAHPGLVDAKGLRELNGKFSKLGALEDIAEARAMRAERNAPTMRNHIERLVSGGAGITGVATALATHDPSYLALPLAVKGLRVGVPAGDRMLAGIARYLERGGDRAVAIGLAMRAGLDRGAAEEFVSRTTAPATSGSPAP